MKVTSSERDGVGILHLTGEFDSFETDLVRKAFEAFIEEGLSEVVIDLGDLTFANSTTIAYLITAQRKALAEGGKVILARPREFIFKTLKTLGLEHVFAIAESLDEAVASLKSA
jgi:anti-sigma B factor antagonist